jgi:uncharacterized membrane protein YoaK (UPF0700 family)
MTEPERPDSPRSAVLLTLTAVSGIVDAVSFLALGHVLVAAMTANVAFVGFAAAGAAGFSAPRSALALLAFLVGGVAVGRWVGARGPPAMRIARDFAAVQFALVAAAAGIGAGLFAVPSDWLAYALVAPLALAMGMQSSGARAMADPDLSRTTVVTTTLTQLAVDFGSVAQIGSGTARRAASIAALVAGAFVGALLLLRVGLWAPLAAAAALVGAVALAAHGLLDRP